MGMVWQYWKERAKQLLRFVKQPFHIITVTLLSLLLPLSFLLLARLSCARNVFIQSSAYSNIFSLVLYTTPFLLYLLVSIVSVAALIHGLTGKVTFITEAPTQVFRPRLYTAWIFLCTLQVCVGLGIEQSIATGIDASDFGIERCLLLSRVIFFLGLHETMIHWCTVVVKPVVDDTVFGGVREEWWVEKVAMAASFGGLWWWRLRDEIESLVVVAKTKSELYSMDVGVADFVGMWLYYLTVTIGMVRVVKGLMWLFMLLLCRGRGPNFGNNFGNEDKA